MKVNPVGSVNRSLAQCGSAALGQQPRVRCGIPLYDGVAIPLEYERIPCNDDLIDSKGGR